MYKVGQMACSSRQIRYGSRIGGDADSRAIRRLVQGYGVQQTDYANGRVLQTADTFA